MRGRVLLTILLLLPLAGCAEPREVPVIVVASTFDRHLPDGSAWVPPRNASACPDEVQVALDAHEVRISAAQLARAGGDPAKAAAVFVLAQRNPEASVHPRGLKLTDHLPFDVVLPLGNLANGTLKLRLDEDVAYLGDEPVRPGTQKTTTVAFPYRAANGTILDVTEHVSLEYVGRWRAPVKVVDPPAC
ncbi:MAG TPA: hypothetical protein VGR28_00390 [Candidatus Thermoplasmatota archaeon]|jgi:hypothetical protein|nr:hypothetical protein [Candidatus Thermoplasmatota archaeon]